ncbi:MAG: nuclear transport factor 2 family protein [Candidatus Dormiibacterota bacterium]
MAERDPKSVVSAMFAAWDAADLDGVMAYYGDDVVVRGPGGMRTEGAPAAREVFGNLLGAYAGGHSEVLQQFVDGDYVITEYRDVNEHTGPLTLMTGEHIDPTGQTVTQEIVFIHHVVNGKIVEETAYFDRHGFLQQIGQV